MTQGTEQQPGQFAVGEAEHLEHGSAAHYSSVDTGVFFVVHGGAGGQVDADATREAGVAMQHVFEGGGTLAQAFIDAQTAAESEGGVAAATAIKLTPCADGKYQLEFGNVGDTSLEVFAGKPGKQGYSYAAPNDANGGRQTSDHLGVGGFGSGLAHHETIEVLPGSTIVVGSFGIFDRLVEQEIARIINENAGGPADATALALVNAAGSGVDRIARVIRVPEIATVSRFSKAGAAIKRLGRGAVGSVVERVRYSEGIPMHREQLVDKGSKIKLETDVMLTRETAKQGKHEVARLEIGANRIGVFRDDAKEGDDPAVARNVYVVLLEVEKGSQRALLPKDLDWDEHLLEPEKSTGIGKGKLKSNSIRVTGSELVARSHARVRHNKDGSITVTNNGPLTYVRYRAPENIE